MGRLTQWLGITSLGRELQKNMEIALSIKGTRELARNLYIITAILYFLETLPPSQVATICLKKGWKPILQLSLQLH